VPFPLVALVAWVPALVLLAYRMNCLLSAYQEGLRWGEDASGFLSPVLNVIVHLYVYITQAPYLVTPIIFCFSLGGLWTLVHRPTLAIRRAVVPMAIVLGLLLLSRLIPTLYHDRHQLPFIPLWILLSAIGFQKMSDAWDRRFKGKRGMLFKNGIALVALSVEIVFSLACLTFQRDSFVDLKRGAEYLRRLPMNARVLSDEIPKTKYWARREVLPWMPETILETGSYLVIHSFYTKRDQLLVNRLREIRGAETLFLEESYVTPLLSDLMEDANVQNRPSLIGRRFETQCFRTWVLRIGAEIPPGKRGR
jgi:hypothetical protein